jgi:hypothetical protein
MAEVCFKAAVGENSDGEGRDERSISQQRKIALSRCQRVSDVLQ